MVDRQDIDALLIGSLYGELSSTEEARLTAHLDSHPSDRTALANLSHAREVVRESRILQVQFEPPQSITALLMQEAARRAPKPRPEHSWFQRFMRSFMTHPAMAAAAMLVLIVGVAGTVYMRKGDHFAKQTKDDAPTAAFETSGNTSGSTPSGIAPTEGKDSPATTIATEQKPDPGADQGPQGGLDIGSGSAVAITQADDFKVQLREDSLKKQPADKVVGNEPSDRSRNLEGTVDGRANSKNRAGDLAFDASERRDQKKVSKEKEEDAATGFGSEPLVDSQPVAPRPAKTPTPKTTAKPAAKTPPRLEVTTPTQGPKDFDSTSSTTTRKSDSAGAGVGGGASSPRSPTTNPQPGNASPPAPPPAPPAEEKQKEKPVDPNLVWAKERHGKLIAAVKAGNCPSAATIAVEIANRTPAYYASNIESDRAIKNCQQYIAQQREKEAERVQRAKSTQRRAADEAPAPAPAKESTK